MEKLPQGTDLNSEGAFTRVGCDYYKRIQKRDRNGFTVTEYKPWRKDEIILDYGKDFLKQIPRYDDFIMKPDNLKHEPVIGDCLNLYAPFIHAPAPGEWIWTERLLKHVFGEQYETGLRYLQILYLHPDRSTIIMALVSTERGTGKTTFINWINALFGANVVILSANDFQADFNAHYATKNIICIEETLFEKQLTIEKLKNLATAKFATVNQKWVNAYKVPFFGKIILTSNNEDKFARIDQEEIRFFVRKLGKPEFTNHNIEADLINEIPAFLYYLQSLPAVDWSVSRSGFTPEELRNGSLDAVVRESKSSLCKDLEIHIQDFFYNTEIDSFYAAPLDIKNRFFSFNNKYEVSYLRSVLKNELKMQPEPNQRYVPFGGVTEASKSGTPYLFLREDFVKTVKLCQTRF